MTEAAHQIASNPAQLGRQVPGSVGIASGPELRIADSSGRTVPTGEIGEVVIRGRNVTSGYVGAQDEHAFLDGGWFRTGDQGYVNEDGYLFLTGRLKEIINRGGETIAPREIDEVLLTHPDVKQALAFPVADSRVGEEVVAAVVLVESATATESSLQIFVGDRLTFAKVPKRILFLDEIPKGPTGKLQRIGLADRLGVDESQLHPAPKPTSADSPATETSKAVGALWAEVLKLSTVDPDDDFLDVGGDSMSAFRLVERVKEEFNVELPLVRFFAASTVNMQAQLIDGLIQQNR